MSELALVRVDWTILVSVIDFKYYMTIDYAVTTLSTLSGLLVETVTRSIFQNWFEYYWLPHVERHQQLILTSLSKVILYIERPE